MRKISHARFSNDDHARDTERSDPRPRRIPGATITSWHGSLEVDLDALFARISRGPSVGGAAIAPDTGSAPVTVSMSDGTQITFAEIVCS
jgi:hypothetical protein